MRIELVRVVDMNGSLWRVVLDEVEEAFFLQCAYVDGWGWCEVDKFNGSPGCRDRIGIVNRSRGVMILDDKKARAWLVDAMSHRGAQPAPNTISEGLASLDAPPSAPPRQPFVPNHRTRNLIEFLTELESGPPAMTPKELAAALSSKLREAFYLLQDLSKAALAARGELDQLSNPRTRPEQYKARIDMFDRWMASLGERCAIFPLIQIPEPK